MGEERANELPLLGEVLRLNELRLNELRAGEWQSSLIMREGRAGRPTTRIESPASASTLRRKLPDVAHAGDCDSRVALASTSVSATICERGRGDSGLRPLQRMGRGEGIR